LALTRIGRRRPGAGVRVISHRDVRGNPRGSTRSTSIYRRISPGQKLKCRAARPGHEPTEDIGRLFSRRHAVC